MKIDDILIRCWVWSTVQHIKISWDVIRWLDYYHWLHILGWNLFVWSYPSPWSMEEVFSWNTQTTHKYYWFSVKTFHVSSAKSAQLIYIYYTYVCNMYVYMICNRVLMYPRTLQFNINMEINSYPFTVSKLECEVSWQFV